MGFLTRDIMETAVSYSQAKEVLLTTELLAPAYYILGGNSTGEGAIISRSIAKAVNVTVSFTGLLSYYVVS